MIRGSDLLPVKERPRQTFCRAEHLKKGSEIKKAFTSGKKCTCFGGKLFYISNGTEVNRVAFTFGKKYGTAVQRNRSRRLSREVYRLRKNRIKRGYDLVFLFYPGNDEYRLREKQLDTLFTKAGLIAGKM